MNLTVDASVVVKWFVPESLSEEARLLLDYPHDFQAPDILLAEFGNTIWKKFRRGEVAFLQPYMDELLGLEEVIALHPVGEQVTRAVQIAGELDHPVYDCLYLACAESTGSIVVTADRRLANKVARGFSGVDVLYLDSHDFRNEIGLAPSNGQNLTG